MHRPKSCLLLFSDAKNTEDYCSVHNSINEIHEFREEKDEKFFFLFFRWLCTTTDSSRQRYEKQVQLWKNVH